MMHRAIVTLVCLLAAPMAARAQDPVKTLPDSYKIQLENAYVKAVRVHYPAGAKLPTHTHGAGTTVYIYLNDSDGIVFRHSGHRSFVINRRPVKAGSMRVSVGQEEDHSVENTSKIDSEFLRLSIKTESGGASGMRRLAPQDASFTSPQLRITRLKVDQHDTATIDAREPALIIELPSGSTRWVEAGKTETIENHEVPELSLVRIDFLTKPK